MSSKINLSAAQSSFGKRVKDLRSQRKMSQEDLGLEAEVDLTSVNEIEKGHRNPKLSTVCKLAKAFNVSPSELLKDLKF